jgi:serine-type D-Ala-D-Ala carboxypeptidase (penicillin-binding protein 5/6)
MKKFTAVVLTLVMVFFYYPGNVHAESKNYKAAILIEVNTGKILYEYNKDEVLPQASITKLMTYYVIRDYLEENSIQNKHKVNVNIDMSKTPSDGSKIKLNNGEEITIQELLESLLIVSANDSALQLETLFNLKSNTKLIDSMNQKSREIGLKNSFYINTSGLTEEKNGPVYNYTTAYETAKLAMGIIKDYPDVLEITSKDEFIYKGIKYPNTNKVLKLNKNVDGLKTGHTDIAGYCLVSTEDMTETNGNGQPLRLLTVVFGCKTESDRINETLKLLKYGEENFINEKIISKDAKFKQNNEYYKKGYIEGSTSEDIYILKQKNENFTHTYEFDKDLPNDIKKGKKIGKLTIKNLVDGSVKVYPLYSADDFESISFVKRLFIHIKQLLSKG